MFLLYCHLTPLDTAKLIPVYPYDTIHRLEPRALRDITATAIPVYQASC